MILIVNIDYFVRFEVLIVMIMKMAVFWDAASCSLVGFDQRFRLISVMEAVSSSETSVRLHGAISQKTAIFNNDFLKQH
jgi:hypothetical protein